MVSSFSYPKSCSSLAVKSFIFDTVRRTNGIFMLPVYLKNVCGLLAVSVPENFDRRGFNAWPREQLLREPRRIEILGQTEHTTFSANRANYRCFSLPRSDHLRRRAIFHGNLTH
jgi:hypothetical protein